jgi:hypothetical protein
MDKKSKCACPTCQCEVNEQKPVVRNGKRYCSPTCANECTKNTCLCVHDQCEDDDHRHQH